MPYAIHLRKSRADLEAEARGEGESLARHRARLLAFAERAGLPVVAEYSEIISGDRLSDRPEMQRLLADVSAGKYDGVLTVEVSRLTRGDLMDQGRIMNTFKYSGTKIITPEHTYDLSEDWDEDVLQSDLMMARREYKYIKRRMQRGRQASASEGLWQGRIPYGYQKVKVRPGKGYTLEPDPQQAPVVRMIFDMYVKDRVGCSTIAKRLNDLGLRTNLGKSWTDSSVMCISKNPVYAGYVTWGKRTSVTHMDDNGTLTTSRVANPAPILSKGKHPALVSQEVFDAAQRARSSNDLTRCHVSEPVRNPLAGLVYCSICGKAMVRKDNGNARGSRYDMLKCPTPGCPTTAIALSIVESAVLSSLNQWASLAASAPSASPENHNSEKIAAAQASLERLRQQRERIYAAFEDGVYDSAAFVARRAEKDKEIALAEQSLESLKKDTAPTDEAVIRANLPLIRNVLSLYNLTTDPRDKNRLLKSVFSRIEYNKTRRCFRNENPANALTLSVYPRRYKK